MRVLVTGANGFVGKYVVNKLLQTGVEVKSLMRAEHINSSIDESVYLENFSSVDEWATILDGIDVVIHLIAKTHNVSEKGKDTYHSYKQVNVGITKVLCDAINNSSVQRLVFLSSIKANGEVTFDSPFTENSSENPEDNYGITKLEAEETIKLKFANTEKDYVIVRPPLIYGNELKGNLETLRDIIAKGFPLPFRCIKNSRSLISLDSLSEFLALCVNNPKATNQTFLVSDNKNYSTSEIIQKIAKDNQLKAMQFCVPSFILSIFLRSLGKSEMERKLLSNLEIDNQHAKTVMNWQPNN